MGYCTLLYDLDLTGLINSICKETVFMKITRVCHWALMMCVIVGGLTLLCSCACMC